jgi:saposin
VFKIKELTVKSVECSLCKYLAGYVEKHLGSNHSSAAVEAALDKACSVLPGPVKTECDKFAHTFAPVIALLLAKNATAEQICDYIKVCNSGTQELTSKYNTARFLSLSMIDFLPLDAVEQVSEIKELSLDSVECSLCKYVVGYVDTVIQNNKSEAAIESALEKVCTILPPSLKTKCTQFVVTYGPVLVQLIERYATPEQVCNALKACHNGTQVTKSTSGKFFDNI